MKDENKELVLGIATGAGITICLGTAALIGRNIKLNQLAINAEINSTESERNLPERHGAPYANTSDPIEEEIERMTEQTNEIKETVERYEEELNTSVPTSTTATSSTSTESSTITSSISTETSAYSLTDEELLALFPPIVQDNSGNVISSTTTVVSETPGQVTSMTSSISGGEVIKEEVTTTYEEVGYETGVSREQQQFICTEGGRFPRR